MAKNSIDITGIPEGIGRRIIYGTFTPFGKVEKLYIYPQDPSHGRIYLETSSAVEEAVKILNGAPPLYLTLRITSLKNHSVADDLVSNSSGSMSNYNNDVMADIGPVLVNVLGVEVPTLSTDDGEVYVPLSAVRSVGFELFEPENVPMNLDFNVQVKKEFELYLSMKARKFLMRHNVEIPSRDIENTKQRLTRKVFPSILPTPKMPLFTTQMTTPNRDNPQQNYNSPNRPIRNQFNSRKNQSDTNPLRKPHSRNGEARGGSVSSGSGEQISQSKQYTRHDNQQNRNNYDEPVMRNGFSAENVSKPNTIVYNKVDDQNKENQDMQTSMNSNKSISVEAAKLSRNPLPVEITLEKTTPPLYKRINLELNVPTSVIISHVESTNKCWVYRKDDQDLAESILFDTIAIAAQQAAVQATVGKICAALFSTAWYRAIVLNTYPTLKVRYLDFGNQNTETLKEVRELPDHIVNIPALAVCLLFDNSPNMHLEDDLEIKIIPIGQREDGSYLVREETAEDVTAPTHQNVQTDIPMETIQPVSTKVHNQKAIKPNNEIKANSPSLQEKPIKTSTPIPHDKPAVPLQHNDSEKPPAIQIRNQKEKQPTLKTKKSLNPTKKFAVDDVGSTGYFQCGDFGKDNVIIAAILPDSYLKEIKILDRISEEASRNVDYIAKIGDTVAVLTEEENTWARGTIINVKNNEYVAALIDYGTVISTNSICHLNKKYADIPEFTCVCSLDANSIKLIEMYPTDIIFTIVEANQLKLEFSNGTSVIVDCKRWDPFLTSPLACVEDPTPIITTPPPTKVLRSRDIVLIVNIGTAGKLYVRTKECNTLFLAITQEISQYDAQPLKMQPVKNQIVLCTYNESNQLYRGIVNSINNAYADIDFIDLGDQETVPLKNLKLINESLASKMSTLIPITLKNFASKEFTENALESLNKHCKEKNKFTAVSTLDEGIFELQDITKACLSEKLLSLDQPQCTAPLNNSYQKIGEYELKIGMNELVCICAEALDQGRIGFITSDSDITNKFVELAEKINNHIETDNKAYAPLINEICLAQFEDEWYRAVVNEADKSADEFDVYYIDYGNSSTVTSSNIRKIPDNFTTMPPLVLQCLLEDISAKQMSKSGLEYLQTLIVAGESYIVDVKRKEDNFYKVIIPSVTTALQAKRLL